MAVTFAFQRRAKTLRPNSLFWRMAARAFWNDFFGRLDDVSHIKSCQYNILADETREDIYASSTGIFPSALSTLPFRFRWQRQGRPKIEVWNHPSSWFPQCQLHAHFLPLQSLCRWRFLWKTADLSIHWGFPVDGLYKSPISAMNCWSIAQPPDVETAPIIGFIIS